ncbi:MAG: cadherin-like beta sandwich domain-containing protein, partial [Firmicutes bacterium]|nr:cadherin-like beta sandwich domain-containing protein [Bacillota bacterium]
NLYPAFDPNAGSYHAFLADGIDEIYVMAEAADRDSLVFYNYKAGETTEADDYDKEWYCLSEIKEGTVLPIQVMDEDGKTLGAYSITFHCGKGSDNNDTDLDSLSVSNQTADNKYEEIKLNKDFSYDKKEYSVNVPANAYNKIRIYAEAFDSKAFVLVDGELVGKDGYVELSCQKGKSYTCSIDVIAANCDDTDSYKLTVNYGEAESKGAYLSGLSAKMYGGAALSLSPVFVNEKMNYTANVPNSVSYISFLPTAASGSCSIELFGYKQESGKWTNYYQLNEGINNIPIYVYEGESKDAANTYYVTIYRQPAQLSTVVSAQKLTIDSKSVQLNAYNINGNNFVKLRDIAYLLNGSAKQFQVSFVSSSNSIHITAGTAYTSNGQENVALASPKRAVASSQSVYLNSAQVAPMAYNIDGNNYLMLRDLALLLDFGMSYDANSGTVAISTTGSYSPNK